MSFENEKAFMLGCLNLFVHGTEVPSEKTRRLVSNLNWDWIIQEGQAGRILPFLLHIFERQGHLDGLPWEGRAKMQSVTMDSEWKNRKRLEEFKTVADLFEKNSILVIPLKGVALSYLVYQESPPRYMHDVDLLIQEADLYRAQKVLLDDGFVLSETKNRWQAEPTMKVIGRWDYSKKNINVDLQWQPRFFVQEELVSWDAAGAWERAVAFEQLGKNVRMLNPVDQVLYLSLQILNDLEMNTIRMSQLLDLVLVMKKFESRSDILEVKMLKDGIKKQLLDFLENVAEYFFQNKSYGDLSLNSVQFFNQFFESSLKPKRGFAIEKILKFIESPCERLLFLIGYMIPNRNMLKKRANLFQKMICFLDHWKEQGSAIFKILLRQH